MTAALAILLATFAYVPLDDAAAAAPEADVFVSPNGNDAWSGQFPSEHGAKGPVASLHRAKEIIAAKLAEPNGRTRDWTVMLRSGSYYLPSKEVFTFADSGGAGHVVRYMSYPGETAIISGGRLLKGFAVDPKTGFWTIHIPEVQAGAWYFAEIWVNDHRVQWPIRPTPGGDRFHVAAQAPPTGQGPAKPYFPNDPVKPVHAGDRFNAHGTNRFGFNKGELDASWKNLTDIRIRISQASANASLIPLAAVDVENHIATMNSHMLGDMMPVGAPWRRENVFEDLGAAPGEMYLDRASGVLTYVPRPGETPATSTVVAPVLQDLMLISNSISAGGPPGKLVGNLLFKDVTFSHTNAPALTEGHIGAVASVFGAPLGAIATIGAANVTFDHVTLAHLGEAGIVFGGGSNHDAFLNSVAHDLGSSAVIAGNEPGALNSYRFIGRDAPSTPAVNVGSTIIDNNLVFDFGKVINCAPAVAVGRGANNKITHNEFRDGPSFGLILGSDPGTETDPMTHDNYVGYNYIHDMGWGGSSSANDFGGIYSVGPQNGTIIEYNKVRDVYSSLYPVTNRSSVVPHGGDAFLLYLDDRSSGVTIRNNLFYNTNNHLYVIKGARHTEYNNIYYSAFPNYEYGNRGYYPIAKTALDVHNGAEGINTYNNIYSWSTPSNAPDAPQAVLEIANLSMRSDRNLYYHAGATLTKYSPTATIEAWRGLGRDTHSLFNVDPRFKNPSAGDFTLPPDSPAIGLGFVPFDISKAGRR